MENETRLVRKPKEFRVWKVGTERPDWVNDLIKTGHYNAVFPPTSRPLEQSEKDLILFDKSNNRLVADDYIMADDDNKEVIGVKADKYAAYVETGFDEIKEEAPVNQTTKRRTTRKPRTTTTTVK